MAIQKEYGVTKNGEEVQQFILKNKNGVEIRCINLGCRLTHFFVPAPNGEIADILLGYDTLAEYESDICSHGSFIGRYANRIENAEFTLNDVTYHLTKNSGNNFLHGNFQKKVFNAEIIGENCVTFTYISPDGEEGFPGELWVSVTYTLTEQNELSMVYEANSTADTYVNFTNHSYFNLAGEGTGPIDNQLLWLNSHSFLETKEDICPSGRILDATGGAFDFFVEKPIGRDINNNDPQLLLAGGYDHAFILEKTGNTSLSFAAAAKDPVSGRAIRVYTTQPSLQFYSANFLNNNVGKSGHIYNKRNGFCLETQHYPCSPNHPEFPSTLLEKGAKFRKLTVFQAVL